MAAKRRYGLTIKSVLYSLAVHAALGVLLFTSFTSAPLRVSAPPAGKNIEPVKARMVSEAEVQTQLKKIQEKEDKKRREQEQAQKKLKQLLAEAKQAEQRKIQEEKKLKEARRKRLQEKKQAEELAKKRKQEQLRLAKLEKQKAAKKRKEQEERKKREAVARKAEQEKRKRAEAEKKRREAELQARLAEEREREIARRVDTLLGRYIPIIRQKVSRNWNKPPNTPQGIEAKVQVRLTATGEVVSVRLVQSSGNSVFDRSVENAVHKASPLPIPQEHGINEKFRNLHLIFKPEDLLS